MKTCNKGGKTDLDWNKPWVESMGRWQLNNHKNKDGECCRSPVKKANAFETIKYETNSKKQPYNKPFATDLSLTRFTWEKLIMIILATKI